MTLDRLTSVDAPVFDGLHHCHRCGDNVRDLTPEHLCDWCAKQPIRIPPPRSIFNEGERHVRAA